MFSSYSFQQRIKYYNNIGYIPIMDLILLDKSQNSFDDLNFQVVKNLMEKIDKLGLSELKIDDINDLDNIYTDIFKLFKISICIKDSCELCANSARDCIIHCEECLPNLLEFVHLFDPIFIKNFYSPGKNDIKKFSFNFEHLHDDNDILGMTLYLFDIDYLMAVKILQEKLNRKLQLNNFINTKIIPTRRRRTRK